MIPLDGGGRCFVSYCMRMHPVKTQSIAVGEIAETDITLLPVIQKKVFQMFPETNHQSVNAKLQPIQ